jgi:hypothetical protein
MYGYFDPSVLGIPLGVAPFDSMLGLAKSVAGCAGRGRKGRERAAIVG